MVQSPVVPGSSGAEGWRREDTSIMLPACHVGVEVAPSYCHLLLLAARSAACPLYPPHTRPTHTPAHLPDPPPLPQPSLSHICLVCASAGVLPQRAAGGRDSGSGGGGDGQGRCAEVGPPPGLCHPPLLPAQGCPNALPLLRCGARDQREFGPCPLAAISSRVLPFLCFRLTDPPSVTHREVQEKNDHLAARVRGLCSAALAPPSPGALPAAAATWGLPHCCHACLLSAPHSPHGPITMPPRGYPPRGHPLTASLPPSSSPPPSPALDSWSRFPPGAPSWRPSCGRPNSVRQDSWQSWR